MGKKGILFSVAINILRIKNWLIELYKGLKHISFKFKRYDTIIVSTKMLLLVKTFKGLEISN